MPGVVVAQLHRLLDRAAEVSGDGGCRSAGLLGVKIRLLLFRHKLQLFQCGEQRRHSP
jgi:hypothetical protein